MNLKKTSKLLIMLFIISSAATAETPSADALFDSEAWVEAALAYAKATTTDPDDGRAWFRLSVSSRESGDLTTARQALEKAEVLQYAPLRVQIERSRQYVLTGDSDAAVAELRQVFSGGFTAVGIFTSDKVLSTMAGDPEFDALIDEMSAQAYPCEHDERFSEFDFWLGEWDVRDAAGNFAGTNRIEKVERGCLITETWSGAFGSSGFSINYLDLTDEKWVQIWNSAGGTQINYRGELTQDGMRLAGQIHNVGGGATAQFRGLWTLLPDGRVRQFFEQSNDGGETWVTWFDGYYTRKSAN